MSIIRYYTAIIGFMPLSALPLSIPELSGMYSQERKFPEAATFLVLEKLAGGRDAR